MIFKYIRKIKDTFIKNSQYIKNQLTRIFFKEKENEI